MHQLPLYQACPRTNLSVAQRMEAGVINLSSSAKVGG